MQRRIIRIITCSKHNAHASPLFKSLRILTLDDMLRLNTLKFYYKYLHNELPPYFYSFNIREQGDRHIYDTRNSGQLQVEMTRTEYADKRLRIYLPTLVNDTPTDILAMITTHCLQDFTKNVKHYLSKETGIHMTPETQVNSKLKWQEPNTLTNVYAYICQHSSMIPRPTYWRWSPLIVFRISQKM